MYAVRYLNEAGSFVFVTDADGVAVLSSRAAELVREEFASEYEDVSIVPFDASRVHFLAFRR